LASRWCLVALLASGSCLDQPQCLVSEPNAIEGHRFVEIPQIIGKLLVADHGSYFQDLIRYLQKQLSFWNFLFLLHHQKFRNLKVVFVKPEFVTQAFALSRKPSTTEH
jgi:hypothetical protein